MKIDKSEKWNPPCNGCKGYYSDCECEEYKKYVKNWRKNIKNNKKPIKK